MVITQHVQIIYTYAKHCTTFTMVTTSSINNFPKPQFSLPAIWANYYLGKVKKLAV